MILLAFVPCRSFLFIAESFFSFFVVLMVVVEKGDVSYFNNTYY